MRWAARGRVVQGSLQNGVEERRKVEFVTSEMGTSGARTSWTSQREACEVARAKGSRPVPAGASFWHRASPTPQRGRQTRGQALEITRAEAYKEGLEVQDRDEETTLRKKPVYFLAFPKTFTRKCQYWTSPWRNSVLMWRMR